MKKTAALVVFAALLVSACVGQTDDVIRQIISVPVISGGVEDITITAKVPEFARAKYDFNWQLVAEPSVSIRDFNITVYDRCVFSNKTSDSFALPKGIRANNTQIFTLSYHTPAVEFERTCNIGFTASYLSNALLSTSVNALSDTEYMQRKAAGTLGEISASTWKSRNPLQISISWGPEGQPLLHNSENYMYINYRNSGKGMIEKLEPRQVVIQVPENMIGNGINCDDYGWNSTAKTLVLKRALDFVQKEAKKSTCSFKVNASQPIDSETITLTAIYKYSIDGQVGIPLLAR